MRKEMKIEEKIKNVLKGELLFVDGNEIFCQDKIIIVYKVRNHNTITLYNDKIIENNIISSYSEEITIFNKLKDFFLNTNYFSKEKLDSINKFEIYY